MKNKNILGISGGPNFIDWTLCDKVSPTNFHDSSAVLVINGKVVSAIEEERITRIKHTNHFPINAIKNCLQSHNLEISDIDAFTFSIEESFLDNILTKFGYELSGRKFAQLLLSDAFDQEINPNKLHFFNHHFSHAASTFYQSGFYKSLVLTIDGMGDGVSGSVYFGDINGLKHIKTLEWSQSLGNFYTHFTEFLGYKFFDEYKIMGLASYGDSTIYRNIFQTMYDLLPNGGFIIHKEKFEKFEDFCQKRKGGDEIDKIHKNIAAALQESVEQIVFHILSYYQNMLGAEKLCLAGGVALNSKLTGSLLYSNLFKDIFVQPAAADNGLAIGSALGYFHANYGKDEVCLSKMQDIYLGDVLYKETTIENELTKWKDYLSFEQLENISEVAANILSQNKVIGWVQGNSEFGPRALGNRSILADPRDGENKQKVNSIIKMRDGYRPFAPSILEEYVSDFFELPKSEKSDYDYMTFVLDAKKTKANIIPAVVHVDGTSRVQTVSKLKNEVYWKLINEFRKKTDIPVLLNTSFNNNIEPIVHSTSDAIRCFLTNKLDILVIDNYLIEKKDAFIDWQGKLAILTLKHVKRNVSNELYSLKDNYLGFNTEISKEMDDVVIHRTIDMEKASLNLKQETFKLWGLRLIDLSPW